jgi:hypothetical protein
MWVSEKERERVRECECKCVCERERKSVCWERKIDKRVTGGKTKARFIWKLKLKLLHLYILVDFVVVVKRDKVRSSM